MPGGLGSSAFSLPLEDVFDVDESAMGVRAKFKSCSPRGNILIVGSRARLARQQPALCLTRTSIRERDLKCPMLVRRLVHSLEIRTAQTGYIDERLYAYGCA